jgi:hypothetical protein
MDTNSILDEIQELKDFLESAGGQPVRISLSGRGQVFRLYGVKMELRVRLDSTLMAITNIEMPTKRRGQGRWVVEWLKRYARSKGLKQLSIEHVTTFEAIDFCCKNGFRPMLIGCTGIVDGKVFGNYVLDL